MSVAGPGHQFRHSRSDVALLAAARAAHDVARAEQALKSRENVADAPALLPDDFAAPGAVLVPAGQVRSVARVDQRSGLIEGAAVAGHITATADNFAGSPWPAAGNRLRWGRERVAEV